GREATQLVDRLIRIAGLGDALGALEEGLRLERARFELRAEELFVRLPRGLEQLYALGRLSLQRRHPLLAQAELEQRVGGVRALWRPRDERVEKLGGVLQLLLELADRERVFRSCRRRRADQAVGDNERHHRQLAAAVGARNRRQRRPRLVEI